MTDSETPVRSLADRIAARGREALVARLRAAYQEAARAHADVVSIDDRRIDEMVHSAADRADGLQWRRALAEVAAGELGISVTQALSHPAVAEAQQLIGAPSYEESLAELIARPIPPRGPEPEVVALAPEPEPEAVAPEPEVPEPEPEAVAPEPEVPEPQPEAVAPEPDPVEPVVVEPEPGPPMIQSTAEHELTLEHHSEPHEPVADEQLRVSALHLGGVANLPVNGDGVDLRLSSSGLDIMRPDDVIIGRLVWNEIDELDVLSPRGRLRRHRGARARLTVRTKHGDASFEIPAFSSDELRHRLDPMIDRYGRH